MVKYRIPGKLKLQKLWLEAIQQPSLKPKKSHGLCMKHFKPGDIETYVDTDGSQFGRSRLRPWVVPSLFPWNKEQHIDTSMNTQIRVSSVVNFPSSQMNVPSAITVSRLIDVILLGQQLFETDVYEETIVADVGQISDRTPTTNDVNNISDDKIR
ncbi:hypothetical protein QAD02_005445 [Eretmocerus hayati]|uniref:Uncharacterized protein n=1 Tax=Eretmocerus hayati TaxID=131215 RepID=A0ACC2NSJ4_9HYME|nr:hypothetical protein QAD02_005445 [Eretmocerus hayati]